MPATPDQTANYAISSIYGGAGGARTPLASGDTTLLLQPGDGNAKGFPAAFPFYMQIGQVSIGGVSVGTMEIIKVTNRVSDTLTIVRSQEGTSAPLQWGIGTPVVVVNTAGMWANLWSHVKNLEYNARDFGAVGDGVTDDTAAIAAMLSIASGVGGVCRYPAGTFITGPQTIASNVYHAGAGQEATTIKLKNGANADLFSANTANINLTATAGTGSSTAVTNFGFRDLTLDGNYANQSSGPCYPLRFYGYGYLLENLTVANGYSGGILCDYNGAFPTNWNLESTWINVRVKFCLGTTTAIGIEMGGPHDSRWTNVLSYHHNSHSVHIAPNNGGLQATGCHAWQSGLADANSCTWLQEASLFASNCEAEGSPYANLVLLSSSIIWLGGSVYAGNTTGLGIQIGQGAGVTPYTNSKFQSAGVTTAQSASTYQIETLLQNITHASGSIWFSSDAGGILKCRLLAASGTNVLYSGTISTKTDLQLNAQGYNDARQQIIGTTGEIAYGQSATAPDPGNNGTITTAGVAVALVNPAAAETGLILQAGTRAGQVVHVLNLSANTLTMAAAATSNVADGTSDVIPATACRGYIWESGFNRWYRLA